MLVPATVTRISDVIPACYVIYLIQVCDLCFYREKHRYTAFYILFMANTKYNKNRNYESEAKYYPNIFI